jgi:hypothetical protein
MARTIPCFRHLGLEQYELGDAWNGVDDEKRRDFIGHEAADVDNRPILPRPLGALPVRRGLYADSTVYGPDKLAPQTHHCPFWRTEIEQSIRFYERMLAAEPTY